MNFGRSINARRCIANRESAPASIVAGWVGNGVTAAWIARHVKTSEWHHTQANLGGNGRPTDFFTPESVAAAWLAANYAARHTSRTARARTRRMIKACRDLGVCELPAAAPLAIGGDCGHPLAGQLVRVTHSYSERLSARRYNRITEVVVGVLVKATAASFTLALRGETRGDHSRLRADTVCWRTATCKMETA